MRVTIVDNGSDDLAGLRRICAPYGDVTVIQPTEALAQATGLAILSGGPVHGRKQAGDAYHHEALFVRQYPGPIIGICAGMQLIAASFGQPLGRLERRVVGGRAIDLTDGSLRMALGGGARAQVRERHGWSVPTVAMPLRALARSHDGIEVVRHLVKPVIGLQFHPESGNDDGIRIFEWAVTQLALPADDAMIYSR